MRNHSNLFLFLPPTERPISLTYGLIFTGDNYSEAAFEAAKYYIKDDLQSPLVKTCSECKTPLREVECHGNGQMCVVVTSFVPFSKFNNIFEIYCSKEHAPSLSQLDERLLTSYKAILTVKVYDSKEGEVEFISSTVDTPRL